MLIIIGLLAQSGFANQPAHPIIAVLEQPPQCSGDAAWGPTVGVRPVFVERGGGWQPLDSVEGLNLGPARFTLAFDGRSLGTVDTRDPGIHHEYYSFRRDHLLDVVSHTPLPRIPNRLRRFEGWCSVPEVRPVVAVNSDHYEDPESWKPFTPGSDVRAALLKQFRGIVGIAYECQHATGRDIPFHYTARDLVVQAAYRNAKGREIVALALRSSLAACDPYGFDPQYRNHWFIMDSVPKHLGDGLDLVDAGDYDGDGHSELIFWTDGEQMGGYVLLYDDLSKRAEFIWRG